MSRNGATIQKPWAWVERLPADFGQTDPWVIYAVFGPLLALHIAGIAWLGTPWLTAALLFVGALALWTLEEYVFHRFSFHSVSRHPLMKPFNSGLHLLHHNDTRNKAYVAAPLSLSLTTYLITLGVFRLLLGDWGYALSMGSGIVAAFIFYEFVHYSTHLGDTKKPGMRWLEPLKRHHMAHHFSDSNLDFGVTSPFWDIVFGSRSALSQRPSKKPSRGHHPIL